MMLFGLANLQNKSHQYSTRVFRHRATRAALHGNQLRVWTRILPAFSQALAGLQLHSHANPNTADSSRSTGRFYQAARATSRSNRLVKSSAWRREPVS